MIQIDRIRLKLPAGFEHRAVSITRLLGEVLARQSVAQDVSLDHISIKAPSIRANTGDEEIAQMIANQIIQNYPGGRQ